MTDKGNYIIGKMRSEEGHTLFLGRVVATQGSNIISGYIEKNSHLPKLRQLFEIPRKDVVLDMGPTPYPGTVHKFDTSHLYTGHRKQHEFFGPIHFFYKPEKEVGSVLMQTFDHCATKLEKLKMPAVLQTVWEINPKEMKGKWAGFYRHSRAPHKLPHTLSIKPEVVPTVISEFAYVVYHEYGHYLHANYIRNPKVNAAWIRLFNTSIKPQTIDKEMSKRLLEALVEGEERPTDFKGQLEEEERLAFNWIIRTIGVEHAVSLKELDTLFVADSKDEIRALWPKRTLTKKELAPIVTEYATKNYHELFAESFAFFMLKKKLPAGIVKLMEKTLRNLEEPEEQSTEGDDQ